MGKLCIFYPKIERKLIKIALMGRKRPETRAKCEWEKSKKILPGRELNPGLACDRRGYSPLYYRGHEIMALGGQE